MVWDTLTRESWRRQLIGRRFEDDAAGGSAIEAGTARICRNTITRKIQELGLDEK